MAGTAGTVAAADLAAAADLVEEGMSRKTYETQEDQTLK